MTNEIHPRVADINARIAAGENLTDVDSQYLDMIGNGYSPEEADRLVPLEAKEPTPAEEHLHAIIYSTKHLMQPGAVHPSEGVTPKISDADWAEITKVEGRPTHLVEEDFSTISLEQAEVMVKEGKALISGGRLMPIHPGTPECEAARFLGMDDLLTHPIQDDDGLDDFFSSLHLSREADAMISFHTVKLKVTTRYAKLLAKKGPRVTRTYRLPPKASVMDIQRGKHRGHLPGNMGGTRLFSIGSTAQGILTADDTILSRVREATLKALALTPEQMAERREAFGRKPGWLRKKFVGQPDNPMSGVSVRNPLPIAMTARYTGHIQMDDRVRATDKWSGKSVEGTVNAITIHDDVETIVGIVTGDGTQYEAPLSEVTKL